MSDIVSPRVESYYLHPKKYAWRPDNKPFNPNQKEFSPEGESITSVITERFKMVINANLNIDSDSSSVISQPSKTESPKQIELSQDAPIDFSVKTSSPPTSNELAIKSPKKQSEMNKTFHQNSESHAEYVNTLPYTQNLPSSSVSLYNNVQQLNQKHFNGSQYHQEYPQMLYPSVSPKHNLSLQNLQLHARSEQQSNFSASNSIADHGTIYSSQSKLNGNQHLHETKESYFHQAENNSPRSSPKLSHNRSPDNRQYKGSILHEVLASGTVERSQAQCLSSYLQKINKSSTSAKSKPPTPPVHSTNAQTNMMMPDTSSMLSANGFIPGPNTLMPSPGFTFFNGMGFAPNAINCMTPFANAALLSPSIDPRMSQASTSDKKQNKQVRPFKAITNELLYGIPAMPLAPMNTVITNNGYLREFLPGTQESSNQPKSSPMSKRESPERSAQSAINSSPCSNAGTDKPEVPGSGDSNCSYPEASNSAAETGEGSDGGKNRKRTRTLPEELKDEAYWERRRKNNQAAKRSRDARRQKEDMVARQALIFREHNLRLQFQLDGYQKQTQCLQEQYEAATEHCRKMELELRMTKDKLARSRCGKCGSRLENDPHEFTSKP